jgi:hypothetical protein
MRIHSHQFDIQLAPIRLQLTRHQQIKVPCSLADRFFQHSYHRQRPLTVHQFFPDGRFLSKKPAGILLGQNRHIRTRQSQNSFYHLIGKEMKECGIYCKQIRLESPVTGKNGGVLLLHYPALFAYPFPVKCKYSVTLPHRILPWIYRPLNVPKRHHNG